MHLHRRHVRHAAQVHPRHEMRLRKVERLPVPRLLRRPSRVDDVVVLQRHAPGLAVRRVVQVEELEVIQIADGLEIVVERRGREVQGVLVERRDVGRLGHNGGDVKE